MAGQEAGEGPRQPRRVRPEPGAGAPASTGSSKADPPARSPSDRYDPAQLPRKKEVDPASFFALDLRIGRVVSVQEFEKARVPAYRVRVDFGPGVGILETSAQVTRYPLEAIQDRLVVAVINIGTKVIAGLASEFLLLGALDPDGTVRLLKPEPESPPGAPVA